MRVLLLDSYNLLFRAFTSIPSAVVAGDGRPINAVYGMVATVLRLRAALEATHIVAAFDEPGTPTFRHRLYPLYQAQRGPLGGDKAEDFARQAAIAQGSFSRIGIPAVSLAGFEADDVMGTLATRVAEARG